jgi:uncharacterized protein (DUF1800 family)
MPLQDFTGVLGHKRAAHLLRRATFGANKTLIDHFATLTAQQAVTQLFRQSLPTPLPPIDPKTGLEWVTAGATNANTKENELQNYFVCWFLGQMMSPGYQVNDALSLAYAAREKLVLFLHTHFTTIKEKVNDSRALYFQNQLFRFFALDSLHSNPEINFKTLTVKVSVDSAMLKVLDGTSNVKGSPNENYARELLELFSIGRGIDGMVPPPENGDYHVFTEQDVKEAARVLSGWGTDDTYQTIDADTQIPRGRVRGTPTNASSHDNGTKQFSHRFNNFSIQPDPLLLNGTQPTEESALDEIRQLVDMIYDNAQDPTSAAQHICWKIYRFYVWGPHAKEEVEPIHQTIIPSLAEIFIANGYKLQPVIEALFRSTHFYEASASITDDNFGAIIKSPIDLVIGTYKFFDVTFPDMELEAANFYEKMEGVRTIFARQGLNFYDPYDVAGYEAYHQFPIYHRSWITPTTITQRYAFIRDLFDHNLMMETPAYVHPLTFIRQYFEAEAGNASTLIVALSRYLFPVTDHLDYDETNDSDTQPPGITAPRLQYFKMKFLDSYTEEQWQTHWATNSPAVASQLQNLLYTMLQTPEYQLS